MKPLKGQLLVAAPQLNDPNFTRTVLLMFEHTEDGAAGLVLNRPTEATVTDLSEQVFDQAFTWEKAINLGGPVAGPLLILHGLEEQADQEILPGVYSTFISSKIQHLIRRRVEPSLVIANCAGWGPGQLEGEIEREAWLSMPARPDHVFRDGAEDLWEAALKQIKAADLSRFFGVRALPLDPTLN